MDKYKVTHRLLKQSIKSLVNRQLTSNNPIYRSISALPLGSGGRNPQPYRSFGSLATKVERNPSFSSLNSDDVSYFKGVLGENNVVQDEDRLETANIDWMHKYKGSSKLLLLPRNTEEVSKILEYCNSRRLAVVPQGGNTGLVGGSVPVFDEVIINAASMNKIIAFDKVSGILVCEAGCILENLISYLDNQGCKRKLPNWWKCFNQCRWFAPCSLWLSSWECTRS